MIRVLYADDDPQISEVLQTYFERTAPECSVETAPNGRSCLTRMQQGGVDVLLLDFEMPDIDGLHILNELAARGDTTPVIMVSGKGQTKLAVKALRAGAVDCIDKTSPQFLELPAIVRHVHARHQAKFAGRSVAPPAGDKYNLLLVEGSEPLRLALDAFFAQHAPQFAMLAVPTLDGLERALTSQVAVDAIIVGPNPGAEGPLDALRKIRSHTMSAPVVVLASRNDGEAAVAAFKLGAQDYIVQEESYLTELVFSLHSLLRLADTDRINQQLSRELAALNRSLEAQVAARTQELSAEVAVRQQAERHAEEHAARLQTLSKRLFKIQEDERRAIARELHDHLGQMLTGLKFQLEALVKNAAAGPSAPAASLQPNLAESLTLATELMTHVRELTQQFRPRILDDLGLRAALEWHARLFQRQTNVNASVEVTLPQERLPVELETVVFRVVQEALTNVARHAGCAEASVTVTHAAPDSPADGEGKLLVDITDLGRGFDLDAVLASRNSIGLTGLTERVTLAGGTVEIYSRAGRGTRIHAEFPLGAGAEPKPELTGDAT